GSRGKESEEAIHDLEGAGTALGVGLVVLLAEGDHLLEDGDAGRGALGLVCVEELLNHTCKVGWVDFLEDQLLLYIVKGLADKTNELVLARVIAVLELLIRGRALLITHQDAIGVGGESLIDELGLPLGDRKDTELGER